MIEVIFLKPRNEKIKIRNTIIEIGNGSKLLENKATKKPLKYAFIVSILLFK